MNSGVALPMFLLGLGIAAAGSLVVVEFVIRSRAPLVVGLALIVVLTWLLAYDGARPAMGTCVCPVLLNSDFSLGMCVGFTFGLCTALIVRDPDEERRDH